MESSSRWRRFRTLLQAKCIGSFQRKKSSLPGVKIKRKDKYDPTLEDGTSPNDEHQRDEEAERKQELKEEEATPEAVFTDNMSNEDIAKIAMADAQSMQLEVDSLNLQVSDLRKSALSKFDLADNFKKQSVISSLD